LSLAATIAKKGIDAVKGELGETAAEAVKKLIDAKIKQDEAMIEMAKAEVEAWRSAFGALPSGSHPVAQILRELVRPVVTLIFTGAVVYGFARGMIEPSKFCALAFVVIGAWYGERVYRHYIARKD